MTAGPVTVTVSETTLLASNKTKQNATYDALRSRHRIALFWTNSALSDNILQAGAMPDAHYGAGYWGQAPAMD